MRNRRNHQRRNTLSGLPRDRILGSHPVRPALIVAATGLLLYLLYRLGKLGLVLIGLVIGTNDRADQVETQPSVTISLDIDNISSLLYKDAIKLSDAAVASGNWAGLQQQLENKEIIWDGYVVRTTKGGYIIRPTNNGPRNPRHEATITIYEAPYHSTYPEGMPIKVSGRVSRINEQGINVTLASVVN